MSQPFPVLSRRNAGQSGEEPAEGGRVGEVEPVCDLNDIQAGGFEQNFRLAQKKVIDVVDNGPAGHLPDDPRQIDGRNPQYVCIERDVMMLSVIRRQELEERDSDEKPSP